MKSIWISRQKKYGEPLNENIERDVVVVGGGIAGILAAYKLAERGLNVTLVEAEKLLSGVTVNTTAHLTALHGYIYKDLFYDKSPKFSKFYFDAQKQAVDEYERIITEQKIDCNFKRITDYLYTIKNSKKLKALYNILAKFGTDVKYTENQTILGFDAQGLIALEHQAIFNPIKFLNSLKKNFEIFENTRIKKINLRKKILYTDKYIIKANKIIIATNYPIVNIRGGYFLKLYKSTSYAICTGEVKDINGIYESDIENGLTFRNFGNQIIIGGLDHRTGRLNHYDKYKRLEEIAKQYFNTEEITAYWNANDVITYDEVPYAGKFNSRHKDIFIITGFNKWGMSNSMACADVIADLVTGKDNKFKYIFSPQRQNFKFGKFILTIGIALKNLILKPILPAFKSYKNIPVSSGQIVCVNGKKKAVYKDEKGMLHICNPFCKHMGCELNFNDSAKTWDCPCHGSRYDIDGNIITAPTVKQIKSYKAK